MKNSLKTLAVADNVSEAFQVDSNVVAVQITTTESSTITVHTSVDGENFDAVDDVSYTIDGISTKNLSDLVEGQYIKIVATAGTMTSVKILG
jgi:hypothetical protein